MGETLLFPVCRNTKVEACGTGKNTTGFRPHGAEFQADLGSVERLLSEREAAAGEDSSIAQAR